MLVFIDESGHPHPKDSTTRPILVSVCLPESRHRDVSRQLFSLKRNLLGREEYELKGTKLLRPKVFEAKPRKRELVESVFDLVRNTDLVLFAIIMERPSTKPLIPEGTLPNQYRFLLQRINAFMEQSAKPNDMAILIFDGQGTAGIPGGLGPGISRYLFRHREGQSWSRILDTPLFVDSKITPGIQLADVMASCIRQYEENELFRVNPGTDLFLCALQRYYRIAESKTRDLETVDMPLFGFYRMPERLFYVTGEEVTEE